MTIRPRIVSAVLAAALILGGAAPGLAGPPSMQDRYRQCRDAVAEAGSPARVAEPGGWVRLGNVAFECGDAEEAIRGYTMALDLDEDSAGVISDRALMFRSRGESSRAVEELRRAASIDPQHAPSRVNLALLLLHDLDDPVGALSAIREVFALKPSEQLRKAAEGIWVGIGGGSYRRRADPAPYARVEQGALRRVVGDLDAVALRREPFRLVFRIDPDPQQDILVTVTTAPVWERIPYGGEVSRYLYQDHGNFALQEGVLVVARPRLGTEAESIGFNWRPYPPIADFPGLLRVGTDPETGAHEVAYTVDSVLDAAAEADLLKSAAATSRVFLIVRRRGTVKKPLGTEEVLRFRLDLISEPAPAANP